MYDKNGNEIERKCKVCGVGTYKIKGEYMLGVPTKSMRIAVEGGQVMNSLTCNRCGHVELFRSLDNLSNGDMIDKGISRFTNPDIKHY